MAPHNHHHQPHSMGCTSSNNNTPTTTPVDKIQSHLTHMGLYPIYSNPAIQQQLTKLVIESIPHKVFNATYNYNPTPGYGYDYGYNPKITSYLFFILLDYYCPDACSAYVTSEYYNSTVGVVQLNTYGETHLIAALKKNNKELADLIIKTGNCSPTQKSTTNDTALSLACKNGYADTVSKLLQFEGVPAQSLTPDSTNNCPLGYILNNGSQRDIQDIMLRHITEDITILGKVIYNNTTLIDLLLKTKQRFDLISRYLDKYCPTHETLTTIVHTLNQELIEKICQNQSCINILAFTKPDTLMLFAHQNGLEDLALKLSLQMAHYNITSNTMTNAFMFNKIQIIKNLIATVDRSYRTLNMKEDTFRTLTLDFLKTAVQMDRVEYVQLLIESLTYDTKDIQTIYTKSSKAIKELLVKHYGVLDPNQIIVDRLESLIQMRLDAILNKSNA
jgi:hypothetical protein